MHNKRSTETCRVAVIWIDWYAYHVARFRGLDSAATLSGRVYGIELVGGIGVHAGLKFREPLPENLTIETLMPDKSWRDADHWQLAKMLWMRLSELDPEVVLVPGYYTLPAFSAAIWARVHGRASVLMTESTAGDHRRVWWKEKLKGLGLRSLFGWAVSGGKAHVAYLEDLGFPKDRVVGFYDVVDNEMFARGTYLQRLQTSAEAGLPKPYFLYVGRLAEEKNVAGLLTSWTRYRNEGGTWPLMLVGDGPERKTLAASASCSGFGEDVHFPGLKSSRELLPFYAHAGCFVLPSTREPWGLVVNEAMASGLPVLVSTRCGCAPDLVLPGLNGFTFQPLDEIELTASLRRIEDLPAEQRNRMGQYSAELIRSYSPQKFGMSIASIYAGTPRQGSLQTAEGGNQ
jgi:1,2-diacylglycerol 3-alpha-glucosyltransferase